MYTHIYKFHYCHKKQLIMMIQIYPGSSSSCSSHCSLMSKITQRTLRVCTCVHMYVCL